MGRSLRVLALILALSASAACSSNGDGGGTVDAGTTDGPSSPSPEGATTPLDGIWESEPTTLGPLRSVLEASGFEEHAKAMTREFGLPERWTMTLRDGTYITRNEKGERFDRGGYEVDGERLTFLPECGPVTFEWSVEDGVLSLQLLDDACPPYEGIPDEVYMRTLYTVAPFTRQEA